METTHFNTYLALGQNDYILASSNAINGCYTSSKCWISNDSLIDAQTIDSFRYAVAGQLKIAIENGTAIVDLPSKRYFANLC